MTEVEKQTTIVSWRPDYDAERLMVSDWIDKDGWNLLDVLWIYNYEEQIKITFL